MSKTLSEHNYHGIDATIIADSINVFGNRITTFVVTFPRIILAELNTHRMFSRNSASSRAIPFKKMLKNVEEHPFIPIAWQEDHSGMQGTEYFRDLERKEFIKRWIEASKLAIHSAKVLSENGLTKQLCNRLLEPFMWHTAIITATEYENFFYLRCPQYEYYHGDVLVGTYRSEKDLAKNKSLHKPWTPLERAQNSKSGAEIHIQALAEAMWDQYNESEPKKLKAGEWHIPFGDAFDEMKIDELATIKAVPFSDTLTKVKIATARCARVSYLNFEGKDDYAADIALHDRLAESGHWSPFEHCARAMNLDEYATSANGTVELIDTEEGFSTRDCPNYELKNHNPGWSGNFRGFVQYRKTFSGENHE